MNIFIAFANQDRDVRDKLLRQMNLVAARQGWNIWSAKEIKAGERWDEEIKQRLTDSEVVILLLSVDFFGSKYIVEKELPEVIAKHKSGNCQIIPVIARVCHWKETPFGEYATLGDIQALPVSEKPIVSRGHWDNDDQPYFEIVQGIRDAIQMWAEGTQSFQIAKKQNEFQKLEENAILHLSKITHQQREREDHDAFEKAQTPQALRAYLKQGFTMYASKAREILDSFGSRPTVVVQRDEASGGGCIFLVLLLIVAVIWFFIGKNLSKDSETPDGLKPSGSLTIVTDTTKQFVPDYTSQQEKANPASDIGHQSHPVLTSNFSYPFEDQMIPVQGGTFTMGSPVTEPSRSGDECQHIVTINSFFMSKYEVTQSQWSEVMANNPSKFNGGDLPVENVSWNDVQTFIKGLNKLTKMSYRLPTEAEWEYAARGGNKSKDYIYAGSNDINKVAWHFNNSDTRTHQVGGKAPNELGLHDMSGNVWEWCQDTWKPYPNCKGTTYNRRIHRGGGWSDNPTGCRIAIRASGYSGPDGCDNRLGFRLAHD